MFILVIVLVGVLFVWKSRRRGSKEDVQMTLANGAIAPPPQRSSDPLPVPDPEALYTQVDNTAKFKTRPKEEPIYSEVNKDNPPADPTYIEMDTTTTKRHPAPAKPADTLYSTTLPPNMNNTTYAVLERGTLDRGRRGTSLDRNEEMEPTYASIQPDEPTYSCIQAERDDAMSSDQQESLYNDVNYNDVI